MEEVLERFRTIEFHDDFDMIVAIANGGIVPAGIINQRLQKEVHLLRINLRDEYQHPKYDAPQLLAPVDFDFKDKSILLVDDRIKTGSTIHLACELLKEARLIKKYSQSMVRQIMPCLTRHVLSSRGYYEQLIINRLII